MYNKEQLKVILSKEENVVIVAPPGSGKTHTMVGAVEEFLEEGNPWTVVITFTNKAADELKKRLSFKGDLEISTIHSWSYRELIRLSQEHRFRVRLLGIEEIYEILKPFMRDYRVALHNIDYVYQHVMGNVNPDLWASTKAKYNAIKNSYVNYKRKMYLYDFTDLPLYLKTKLEDYNEYIYLDGLFVDEFQDVDPDQLEVFNRVISKKKFFIGDTDQAIYIFRGATEEIFRKLNGFTVYKLNTNYRSYQEIIDFAYDYKRKGGNLIDFTFENENNHGVLAARGKGAVIIHEDSKNLLLSYPPQNAAKIYENGEVTLKPVKEVVLDELDKYKYQFLCRTNREVKELEKLGIFNASTIHKAKGLEYDNVAIISFTPEDDEDLNVAFVGLTRARNRLMVIRLNKYLRELYEKNIKAAF